MIPSRREYWFVARHSGRRYYGGGPATWSEASFGERIAVLAVLALLGSVAAFLSIPAAAIISALF